MEFLVVPQTSGTLVECYSAGGVSCTFECTGFKCTGIFTLEDCHPLICDCNVGNICNAHSCTSLCTNYFPKCPFRYMINSVG